MNIWRPQTAEGKTVLWCLVGVLVSWLAFGLCNVAATATGCELNEGMAGTCMFLGINWMPWFSGLAMCVGIAAFFLSPVALFIALGCGTRSLVRREW